MKSVVEELIGRGCSTVVDCSPFNKEVEGSNPTGTRAFFFFFYLFLLSFTIGVSLIRSLKEVHL